MRGLSQMKKKNVINVENHWLGRIQMSNHWSKIIYSVTKKSNHKERNQITFLKDELLLVYQSNFQGISANPLIDL